MRWPFRRSHQAVLAPEQGETERSAPERVVRRSPTLRSLFDQLGEGTSHEILDLGPAVGTNIEFFSHFSCRLRIIDLIDSLRSDEASANRALEHPEAVFEELMPTDGKRFDVVLAWDVFNYLDRYQFRVLADHLARLCRPRAHLFALISSAEEISDQPLAFKILDEEHLAHEPRTPVTRANPGYSAAEAECLFDGFTVHRIMLLRQGIREYLLIRRGEAADPG